MGVLRQTLISAGLVLLAFFTSFAQDDSCVITYEAVSGGAVSQVPDSAGGFLLAYDATASNDLSPSDSLDDAVPPFPPPGGWYVALSNPSDLGMFWGRADARLIDPSPGTENTFQIRVHPRFSETGIDSVHFDWSGPCFTPPNVTVLRMSTCDETDTLVPDMTAESNLGLGRASSTAWDDEAMCLSILASDDLVASVKLFLEGPFAGGKMAGSSNTNTPLEQPYGDPAFDGTPLDFDSVQSVLSLPDSTIDWVLIALRTGTGSESAVAASKHAAVLLDDGSVVESDGSPLRFAGLTPGGYHIVARHRNHLAVLSADTLDLSDGIGAWDFTTDLSQAYSNGGAPMAALDGGVFGLFAGEGTGDGFVTAPDFNLWNAATTSGATGYDRADYNLDGFVTAPDFNLWNANTTAGASSQVPE
jgi:hypothetical protein